MIPTAIAQAESVLLCEAAKHQKVFWWGASGASVGERT